jgi:hemerythrin-like domain-containing protein
MMPTDQLVKEHVSIQLMLSVLEQVCSKLDAGEKVSQTHLKQILEFIKVLADQCHHGKEEEFLFPAMEKVGIPRDGGPIGVMLAEHTEGRQYVKELGEAIERYGRGDPTAVAALVGSARKYVELLNAHIEKENGVLFPMAEEHLPERKKMELLAAFDRVDDEKIGKGRHEHMQGILKKLTKEYLS